jgi:hypothetical protein
MKTIILLLIFLATISQVNGAEFMSIKQNPCNSERKISLDDYKWKNRVVVLFATDAESDLYQSQMDKFESLESGIKDRDLLFISIFEEGCSEINSKSISDKSAASIRKQLRKGKDPFQIVLIGKDGTVKLQRNEILSPDELFDIIDQMPMRRREMKEGL